MFSSYTTSSVDLVFFDWYQILKSNMMVINWTHNNSCYLSSGTFIQNKKKNLLRKKKNSAADKFPLTDPVKILLVFSFKVEYVNNALFFWFVIIFSNVCRWLLTLQILHIISFLNWLMPGGKNKSYVWNKPAGFTYWFVFKHQWIFHTTRPGR